MAGDGVETLQVYFWNPANNRWIVGHVLQPDLRRPVDARVRRPRVVVAARDAEPEVGKQRRLQRPARAKRETLRAVVVRTEGVVERSFRQPLQRRRTERQRVDETVAPEHRDLRRELVIDAHVELVLPRVSDWRGGKDRLPS